MENYQQNKLTMLQTLGLYLAEGGASLAAIKRIGMGATALAGVVSRIETAVRNQATPTAGATRSREDVKAEAGAKAEVLRQLIVALSPDATLLARVKEAVSKHLHDKDADLLRYLAAIAEGVGTLAKKDLEESGYDAGVLTTLQADLKLLTDTQGATRQIQIGTSGATEALPALFAEADAVLDKQLDPLVRAQKLAQPEAVRELRQGPAHHPHGGAAAAPLRGHGGARRGGPGPGPAGGRPDGPHPDQPLGQGPGAALLHGGHHHGPARARPGRAGEKPHRGAPRYLRQARPRPRRALPAGGPGRGRRGGALGGEIAS